MKHLGASGSKFKLNKIVNCLVSVDADSENINLRIKKIYYWNSGSKLVAVCEDKDGNIENKFI